jgi:hypothetical protein
MKFHLILFLILSLSSIAIAQHGTPQNAGARGAAMSNASVTFNDINSAFSNQAGLAFVENISFCAYGERRFLAEGLNSFLFAAAVPLKSYGTFGLTVNHFGFNDYNEQKIGLSYARKLAKNFSIGAQLDYLSTRIPDYGVAGTVTVEIGILANINKQVSIGAHVYNPVNSKLNSTDRLPALINVGVSYSPSPKVMMSGQLEKDINNQPLKGRFGLEYKPVSIFSLRAGFVASQVSMASFGFGILLKDLQIDVASSYHQVLGITPSLSIIYSINKNKIVNKEEE